MWLVKMWLVKGRALGRTLGRTLGGILMILSLVLVTGCGFHAVYDRSNFPGLARQLAAIEVVPIPDRRGQLMRSRLQERLQIGAAGDESPQSPVSPESGASTPATPPPVKNLQLKVSTSELIYGVAARLDNTSVYSQLYFRADYNLIERDSGKSILKGSISSSSLYAMPEDGYAETVAVDSARENAISELADVLILRLQAFLAHNFQVPPKTTEAPSASAPSRMR
ncbi:MAG: hypothetical protein QM537_02390 [Candidatus Symbiobacter sp.]|nr:hypothetical protein [Candidatus Symbiobacter sp.]